MVSMEVSDKGMTVDQLWQLCVNMRRMGHGKRHILISSDDECNSFHALWSGFEVDQVREWLETSPCDIDADPEETALLM